MLSRINKVMERLTRRQEQVQEVEAQIRVLASELRRMQAIRDLGKGAVITVKRGKVELPAIMLAWVDDQYSKARVLVERGPDSTVYTVGCNQIGLAAPCPEYLCTDRTQCWEPCGDLGKTKEHAKVAEEQPKRTRSRGHVTTFSVE